MEKTDVTLRIGGEAGQGLVTLGSLSQMQPMEMPAITVSKCLTMNWERKDSPMWWPLAW